MLNKSPSPAKMETSILSSENANNGIASNINIKEKIASMFINFFIPHLVLNALSLIYMGITISYLNMNINTGVNG